MGFNKKVCLKPYLALECNILHPKPLKLGFKEAKNFMRYFIEPSPSRM